MLEIIVSGKEEIDFPGSVIFEGPVDLTLMMLMAVGVSWILRLKKIFGQVRSDWMDGRR